ncbi:piggyBac transposable element-derived protein 2-like [Hydra vulgaris]|uniref:PiggyBac transposable element-derived protein 2-like n=1 Tax=Hydra vulgaris TaxID=6087 RepID=A0ABM4BBI7_HYDVU
MSVSSRKRYRLHEVLQLLEDTDDECLQSAEISIVPPITSGADTDEDSGDENEVCGDPNSLNRNQLLAEATMKLRRPNGTDVIEMEESDGAEDTAEEDNAENNTQDTADDIVEQGPQHKRTKKQVPYKPSWVKSDFKEAIRKEKFPWTIPPPKVENHLSPVSLFELFMTPEIMHRICNESKEYAAQKGHDNFDVDITSLKLFLSILLISGYAPLPRRPMYWETAGDVHNSMVSAAMSYNKFSSIMSNIHFANNNELDMTDRFAKVRSLIQFINAACLTNFQPEQIISIDESMVPYYGKHSAKQYIHGKPIKFGYKMWVAATRLGYVINFYPYQGAGTTDKDLGLGGLVVVNLTKDLPKRDGNFFHIVFDNLFTSPRLLRLLVDRGMAAMGTLRSNRTEGAPLKNIKAMDKLPRGSHDVALDQKANVCLVRWHDSKVVTVAPLRKAKRYSSAQKKRIDVDQPSVKQLYNYGMGGVDRLDQNLARYMIQHRSKKWYWPIFRFCVDLAVQNAFQLYRIQEKIPGAREQDLLLFRRQIAQTYVQTLSMKKNSVPYPPPRVAVDR